MTEDVQALRDFMADRDIDSSPWDDEQLARVIADTRRIINGRRLSWKILSAEHLTGGRLR